MANPDLKKKRRMLRGSKGVSVRPRKKNKGRKGGERNPKRGFLLCLRSSPLAESKASGSIKNAGGDGGKKKKWC